MTRQIQRVVLVEEIATQSEMEKARFHRLREGKHIPTLVQKLQTQVRKDVEYMTAWWLRRLILPLRPCLFSLSGSKTE